MGTTGLTARGTQPIAPEFPGTVTPVGSRVRFGAVGLKEGGANAEGTNAEGTVTELQRWRAVVVTDKGRRWKVPYGAMHVLRRAPVGECSLADVASLAEELLAEHKSPSGLDGGWRFGFDLSPSRAGSCKYAGQRIDLAVSYCLKAPRADIVDTLLHEIAHAIVGPRHNHDAVWRAKARQIGCSAQRCHDLAHTAAPWIGECGCPRQWYRHRLQRRMRRGATCAACGKDIAWRLNTGTPLP